MRSLRIFIVPMLFATAIAACGGSAATQPPTATMAPGAAANGSITYTITGDMTASGEMPFVPSLSAFNAAANGWVATFTIQTAPTAIALTTQAAGQVFNFSSPDGSVVGTSDPSSGNGCTFTMTQNDAAGLAGTLVCTSATVVAGPGAGPDKHAVVNAQWNAHP